MTFLYATHVLIVTAIFGNQVFVVHKKFHKDLLFSKEMQNIAFCSGIFLNIDFMARHYQLLIGKIDFGK